MERGQDQIAGKRRRVCLVDRGLKHGDSRTIGLASLSVGGFASLIED